MHRYAPCFTRSDGRAEALFMLWVLTAILFSGRATQAQETPPVNLALGKDSYMVRLQDNLPPASYGNDDNFFTAVRSTSRTVDAYWEVDLEQAYALDSVLMVADDGFGDRMTHATVRLFDGHHESVFSLGHRPHRS